jgi:hypothetical protein
MRYGGIIAAVMIVLSGFGVNSALNPSSANGAVGAFAVPRPQLPPRPIGDTESNMPNEIKTLAEAQRGGLENLFIAVAYDAERYQAIRGLSAKLPDVDAEVFKTSAVVAVFLGQRSTGGYAIKIEPTADGGISIFEIRPEPGTMVQQVLSSPYKVVAVPVTEGHALNITLEPGMNFNAQRYRVDSGQFTVAGGIAGRKTKFGLSGHLTTFHHEQFVSVWFDLKTTGGDKPRVLRTLATGTVDAESKMVFPLVDVTSLAESASTPTKAVGTRKGLGLSISFSPAFPVPADGIYADGEIQAQFTPVK